MAIQSFRDARAEAILNGRWPGKGFPADLVRVAARKLEQLEAAVSLDDLRFPPANRLKALKGSLAGRHAIRINDQFRVVFKWTAAGPADVEILDYH